MGSEKIDDNIYLEKLNIKMLNEMQVAAIESVRTNDTILIAPTGSGKTMTFLLPLINNIDQSKKITQALILVPSRELALQIDQVLKQMQPGFKITCAMVDIKEKLKKTT